MQVGGIPGAASDDDDDNETNPFIDFIISPLGLIIISICSATAIFGISILYFKHKRTLQVKKDIKKKLSQSSSSNT